MTQRPINVTQSIVAARPDESTRVQIREWTVEVASGPDKGKKVSTLERLVRVGSDPSNDLVLTDATVSRRHLEVERTSRGLVLRDLGSRNGSWLDGRQVLQAFLEPGDKIELGQTKLVIKQESRPTEVEVAGADSFGALVGTSEQMRTVFALLRRLATEELNLLLEGETGTGKELAARAVHDFSARRHRAFKVVDCSRLADEGAESELLGAGSTGTDSAMDSAQGGTLFLDEVGELPLELQPKLLRLLETRELARPGGRPAVSDVRIIASTQRNLQEEVRLGRFRADLYFRLAVAKVRLPPLRTRREDIPILAQALLRSLRTTLELSPQTLSLFENYDWPGNVRELRNVLERGALMQEAGGASWLDFLPSAPSRRPGEEPRASVAELVLEMTYQEAKDRVSADFERIYFAEVMKRCQFDMKQAEEKTGLSMQSLYRLLKKNGLRLKDLRNAEGLEK